MPKQDHPRRIHDALDSERLGVVAEVLARFFGTPQFIAIQSLLIVVWITLNVLVVTLQWDPYPFILLNLMFSTQAAYAAPLILLADSRAEKRAKILAVAEAQHREQIAQEQLNTLNQHTRMLSDHTKQLMLQEELHDMLQTNQRLIQEVRNRVGLFVPEE